MESHNRIALYLQVQNTLDVRRFAILYREELASVCSLTVNDGCVRKWNTGGLKTELRVSIRISFRFCRFHWGCLGTSNFQKMMIRRKFLLHLPISFPKDCLTGLIQKKGGFSSIFQPHGRAVGPTPDVCMAWIENFGSSWINVQTSSGGKSVGQVTLFHLAYLTSFQENNKCLLSHI